MNAFKNENKRATSIIEGYASLFGVADGGGDIVMPGAFRDSLARKGPANIRMLFQHDPAEPVGVWTQMREDARGLFVRGHLTPGVFKADDLQALIDDGAMDGLSIGFQTLKAQRDRGTGLRRLFKIDLWEISLVTFPMLTGARLQKFRARWPNPSTNRLAIRN
jgi:HK97 family phage prohead protease